MGLTQAISLNICAHFEPITCYQDHTQNVKDSLHYFGDAIPDVLLGEAQHFENGEVHYRTIAEIEIGRIAPPLPRHPRNAGGTAAAAAPAIGRAAAPSSGRPPAPQSPPV